MNETAAELAGYVDGWHGGPSMQHETGMHASQWQRRAGIHGILGMARWNAVYKLGEEKARKAKALHRYEWAPYNLGLDRLYPFADYEPGDMPSAELALDRLGR